MKAKTTLTAKDIANIKNALESVCLDSNRANRKRMRELEREVKKLRDANKILEAYTTDSATAIVRLQQERETAYDAGFNEGMKEAGIE